MAFEREISNQKNGDQRLMRLLITFPILLGSLLLIVGFIGIYVDRGYSNYLKTMDEEALAPTLAFNQIVADLNLLYEDYLRLNLSQFSGDGRQDILRHSKAILKRIDAHVMVQRSESQGQKFENYFKTWIQEWEVFEKTFDKDTQTIQSTNSSLVRISSSFGSLIEKMENISTFIDLNAREIIENASNFSKKITIIMLTSLLFGLILGAVLSIIIIGRIRKLLTIMSETRIQLIQSNKLASLGELSAGVAHEINNPLAIISGSVEILHKIKNDPEKIELRIETIQKATQRISKIVTGLKRFSRSSENQNRASRQLADIVKEAVVLTELKAKQFDTKITCELNSDSSFLCDEAGIEQVLVNLINNGIDAIKGQSDRWIEIKLYDEDQNIILRVTDSGPGIPEDVKSKLFQPFFTTKSVGEGTGLGLSIVKGIVIEHGGTINVATDVQNTCFEVRFQKLSELKAA